VAKLEAELAEYRAATDKAAAETKAQLDKQTDAMRATLLDKLGVLEKYKGFAPKVDPFSKDGRAKLEEWASDNQELLAKPASQQPEFDPEKALGDRPRSHLFDPREWKRSRHEMGVS